MYVVYRGRTILSVSDKEFFSPEQKLKTLKLPASFSDIPKNEIITDYEIWNNQILHKSDKKNPKELKIAFVGVYRIKCGISTYSEWLFPEIAKHFGGYRIFAELDEGAKEEPNVVRCWKRGTALTKLVEEIDKYEPDVVMIQHEYGIFPVARHWLAFIGEMQRYRTYTTLHSIYRHKDKTVCEAALQNVFVHTNAGAKILKEEKKIKANVHVIPHLCLPNERNERFWNIYQSPHTLVQFGFGFKYKGWEQAIEVVNVLKDEFPDLFFTGLFSESDQSKVMHDQYFYELMDHIKKLNLTKHIAIIRGYQSDETLDSYLRTNKVALFPYIENGEHTVFGCSGAARVAMRSGIPTIVTSVPLFDDLEGTCPRPKNVAEICDAVRLLFTEANARKQVELQNKFLTENSLENVAKRYTDIMCS